ncbi:hypothetical protein KR009_006650, partial [Drosophila setifemur]
VFLDSPNSNDRDAGFCSASSESEGGDDLAVEHSTSSGSPAIGSKGTEDFAGSVQHLDVGKPIALVRNKRKSSEPSKVVGQITSSSSSSSSNHQPTSASSAMNATGPLKKRIRYTSSADSAVVLTPPALESPPPPPSTMRLEPEVVSNPAHIYVRHPGVTTLHRNFEATQPEQLEPLALVTVKKEVSSSDVERKQAPKKVAQKKVPKAVTSSSLHDESLSDEETESKMELCLPPQPNQHPSQHHHQRNYKNMTRERRIEANARERTRVHTISAAYETLRRAVPAYASSQKLSKLSVLRVACSYILTLSRMAGEDYSEDQSEPSIADCMEAVTSTIQTEGKVKRRKDE